MDLRTTCPDCGSDLALFLFLGSAAQHGGLTVLCDRVSLVGGSRQYDPCGFAARLTRDELIDVVLRTVATPAATGEGK